MRVSSIESGRSVHQNLTSLSSSSSSNLDLRATGGLLSEESDEVSSSDSSSIQHKQSKVSDHISQCMYKAVRIWHLREG